MGVKVRERPKGSGVYWIFIDHQSKRKAKKIGKDKRLANEVAKKIEAKLTLGDLDLLKNLEKQITFRQYAEEWLHGYVATTLKYSTYKGYNSILNTHLLPKFGKDPLPAITRQKVKKFLLKKIRKETPDGRIEGLSHGRVKHIKSTMSGIMTQAMEDGHITVNPASRLGYLFNSKDQTLENEIEPYTAEELDTYLETCEILFPQSYPFFLTLARTGMRLGEGLALKTGDIDFASQFIEIKRAFVENRLTTPKSGKSRRVDMSPQLAATLKNLIHQNKVTAMKKGWGEIPEWLFFNEEGKPLDQGNVRARIHYKVCEKSSLRRARIHDLRHSYATIRISAGHNIADVSRQLGHASIKITVDTYYHWIPNQASNEVADLDKIGKNRNNPQPIRNQNKKGLTAVELNP
jgi:integrase